VQGCESLKVYSGYLIQGYNYLKGEGILTRSDIEREDNKINGLLPLCQTKNRVFMNVLKQYYIELLNLKYTEENIAELFSIANRIIKFLKSKNPSRKTNKALHYVMLTKEREFQNFKGKLVDDLEHCFKDAKFNLMADLSTYCFEYWDPIKDTWNK
jgi:hypothetical protein